MRINVILDEDLVHEAQRLTGIVTKQALMQEALKVLVMTKKRKSLLEIEGRIKFFEGYDHKALREDRV